MFLLFYFSNHYWTRYLSKGIVPLAYVFPLTSVGAPTFGKQRYLPKRHLQKRTFSEPTCVDLCSELSELFSSSVSPAGVWEEMSNSVGFPWLTGDALSVNICKCLCIACTLLKVNEKLSVYCQGINLLLASFWRSFSCESGSSASYECASVVWCMKVTKHVAHWLHVGLIFDSRKIKHGKTDSKTKLLWSIYFSPFKIDFVSVVNADFWFRNLIELTAWPLFICILEHPPDFAVLSPSSKEHFKIYRLACFHLSSPLCLENKAVWISFFFSQFVTWTYRGRDCWETYHVHENVDSPYVFEVWTTSM